MITAITVSAFSLGCILLSIGIALAIQSRGRNRWLASIFATAVLFVLVLLVSSYDKSHSVSDEERISSYEN